MKNRSRKRKAASGEADGPTIKFDCGARLKYITGFAKRKQERRKKAVADALEKERWDKIQTRKDLREEVKKNWREMQRSEALTMKALGDVKDNKLKIQDAPAEDDSEVQPESAITVAFAQEEDDPFGDCEVTTTNADWNPVGGGMAANASKLWPALLQSNGTATGGHLLRWEPEDVDADAAAADAFAKQRRRAVVKKEEEERQSKALARRVDKTLELKRRFKPKKNKGNKKKDKKNRKTTHRTRRRVQKNANKKGGRK